MRLKLSTAFQFLFIGVLLAVAIEVVSTARENVLRQNIVMGWNFLFARTGWDVGTGLLPQTTADPYWWTFLVGLVNTLVLSASCICAATATGFLLALLSSGESRILERLTRGYVWIFRNIPIIVQVFFWYHVTREFPPVRQAARQFGCCYVTNRGIYVPSIDVHAQPAGVVAALLVCLAAYLAYRGLRRSLTGRWPAPAFALVIIPLCVAAAILSATVGLTISRPRLQGFNFVEGTYLSPEFAALAVAIVAYNTAFIAEIVKAGIRSIPVGQVEAARIIGLSNTRIFWTIILPQALRVATPALINQYISITKSSSLAIAIGYTDLFAVGTIAINHTGQSIEIVLLLMLVYLTISSGISTIGNAYNRSITMRGAK
ncbi:MAG: ABC transporter permease subunit [Beijerinckiaceae bacterium]